MTRWYLITGEYLPINGGVGDYTRLVACALAEAGDEVHVFAPECPGFAQPDPGVSVHRFPGHWGPNALAAAGRTLDRAGRGLIVVQYVPHGYGLKAMNLPFCLWLYSLRRHRPWVMFHEVAYPFRRGQKLRHNMLGGVTHLMAAIVARSAGRIFVAIPAWEVMVRRLAPRVGAVTCLPLPSNVQVIDDPTAVAMLRTRCAPAGELLLGYFGSCTGPIYETLARTLASVMAGRDNIRVLLIGPEGPASCARLLREHPELGTRVHATGALSPEHVSCYIAACDLMVQPYPDGVSGRRTSAMAVLAHGRPLVTTAGPLSEPLWGESGAVALAPAGQSGALVSLLARLLEDPSERSRYARAGRELYLRHFDLKHTVAGLRAAAVESTDE